MEGRSVERRRQLHVITGDDQREIVARLYFVDTPEAETAYRDRLDEQAAYFGISRAQAVRLPAKLALLPRRSSHDLSPCGRAGGLPWGAPHSDECIASSSRQMAAT
jgi:hypothetical protein